jgi:2-polyprenyl-3-methyl-5-hydroxy-6-metoxy-1,4-benzoquinol methylase
MDFSSDPIGYAIWDFSTNGSSENIIVQSDMCDDDLLQPSYLCRSFEEMPEIEKFALLNVDGKTLDVGAGSGCHSLHLMEKGHEVTAIDTSRYAIKQMKNQGIKAVCSEIENYNGEEFDTILLLMNGLGLAKRLSNLDLFLTKLKSLIKPEGKIICDSSDISYLFKEDDGGMWMDLNAEYFGEMKFNMVYKDVESGWFDWIYVDPKTLKEHCEKVRLSCEIIFEGENDHYLAELKHL